MTQITHQEIERLIGEQGAALVLYARQWCSDPDDAVQEAFVELVRLASAPVDPVAWLFTATKRRAMNQSRGESRRRNRNKLVSGSKSETASCWFSSQLESVEEAQQLQLQLERLEPLEREIVVAHVWGELTFAQIATLVEISSSTAHRHFQHALAKLKRAFEKKEPKTITESAPPTQIPTRIPAKFLRAPL